MGLIKRLLQRRYGFQADYMEIYRTIGVLAQTFRGFSVAARTARSQGNLDAASAHDESARATRDRLVSEFRHYEANVPEGVRRILAGGTKEELFRDVMTGDELTAKLKTQLYADKN